MTDARQLQPPLTASASTVSGTRRTDGALRRSAAILAEEDDGLVDGSRPQVNLLRVAPAAYPNDRTHTYEYMLKSGFAGGVAGCAVSTLPLITTNDLFRKKKTKKINRKRKKKWQKTNCF